MSDTLHPDVFHSALIVHAYETPTRSPDHKIRSYANAPERTSLETNASSLRPSAEFVI